MTSAVQAPENPPHGDGSSGECHIGDGDSDDTPRRNIRRLLSHGIVVGLLLGLCLVTSVVRAADPEGCEPEPITAETPTGIAGCERWGIGTASRYGPGTGVAMNFCTWELRHSTGCGMVAIRSLETGIQVISPVIDFCDCYTGTSFERIVDLQYGVVAALGLHFEEGLWPVEVTRFREAVSVLPDTAYNLMAANEAEPYRLANGPDGVLIPHRSGPSAATRE